MGFRLDQIVISRTTGIMANNAATHALQQIKSSLAKQRTVRMIAATGNSQLEMLELLVSARGIDWKRVELFHLDEYVGIGQDHPASFARYIKERIIDKTGIEKYHLLDGLANPEDVIAQVGAEIRRAPVDLALIGIGENGHLAFNDPPADFDTQDPYLVVSLDERCRLQQVNEGWFPSLEAVPQQAITMSIQQNMKAKSIVCTAPDQRKAEAVRSALCDDVTPLCPASVLRYHGNAKIFLDAQSASLLQLDA